MQGFILALVITVLSAGVVLESFKHLQERLKIRDEQIHTERMAMIAAGMDPDALAKLEQKRMMETANLDSPGYT